VCAVGCRRLGGEFIYGAGCGHSRAGVGAMICESGAVKRLIPRSSSSIVLTLRRSSEVSAADDARCHLPTERTPSKMGGSTGTLSRFGSAAPADGRWGGEGLFDPEMSTGARHCPAAF
jgi:hypothetical protein